jgi:drug/metabolite transporter (DMT)-like permease
MYRDKNTNIAYRQPSAFNDYFRLALAGLFFAGNISFWHWSIKLTSIANSTLLANFAPIFIILGGFCFLVRGLAELF